MRVGTAFFCALLLLSGCATTTMQPVTQGPVSTALERDYYQVRIETHDGKKLAATVYQPELAPGATAPLIIATHGFGGFRAKRPLSIYGKFMLTGEAALEAWKQGYWVVFYEQRGWGDSGDVVHLMDPEFEVRDVSTVIDWSLQHIPGVAKTADGDWAIGMIGESYGGAAQTLAAFNEPRLKALVPLATWHDLNAIAPHQHMKTSWGAYMLSLGTFSSRFDTGFMLSKPFRSGFSGTLSFDATEMLYERSPAAYCDQGLTPKADALFVHGFRDTMFPLQEALKNQECFQRGENDARLVAIQGGHILPWTQDGKGLPLFNTDAEVHCGEFEDTLVNTVVAWWDEKLKGAERRVPDTCVTLDYETGLADATFPDIEQRFRVPSSKVLVPFAGMFEWLMIPMDRGFDLFWRKMWWPGADRRFLTPNGGIGRPKFIPLYIAHENEVLSGIPTVDIHLDGDASVRSTRVFVGIGVQRAGLRRVHVASDQLTPLPKKGRYEQELPAVSMPLEPGDRVGLVVYGYTTQFFSNPSFWTSTARIRGEATLPVMEIMAEK